MKALQFKLTAATTAVTLDEKEYVLTEMTAAARDTYLDQLSARMNMGADGKATGLKKFEGMQADLITVCLKAKTGESVPASEIQSWPASTVSSLFQEAQALNHLSLEGQPPKNA
jgi:hypothetical protein